MSQRIKVLQVLEATTGGTRRHLMDLVSGLDRDRFEVSLICSTRRDQAFLADIEVLEATGVDVTVVPMVRRISPIRDLVAFVKILRHMKRGNYSVVHTHSAKAGFLGRLAAKMAGVPTVIHTPHVFPFQIDAGPVRRATYFCLEKSVAGFADKTVCVCPSQRDVAVRKKLVDPAKLVVVENGIRPGDYDNLPGTQEARTKLGIEGDGVVVGAVGRLTKQKGLAYLLCAAVEILAVYPETRFVFVGDGRLKQRIEALALSLGVAQSCTFIGQRDDVDMLLSAFDIVAMPSLWEGLPYVLLEAMASRRAIVASHVGGIPDAVESGETGLLVPPADVGSLVDAITRLVGDPDLRGRLGSAARTAVLAMPPLDSMVKATSEIYSSSV